MQTNKSFITRSFSLTKRTISQLKTLAEYLGMGDSAALRYLILKEARELNIQLPKEEV